MYIIYYAAPPETKLTWIMHAKESNTDVLCGSDGHSRQIQMSHNSREIKSSTNEPFYKGRGAAKMYRSHQKTAHTTTHTPRQTNTRHVYMCVCLLVYIWKSEYCELPLTFLGTNIIFTDC